jgi:uncharacterized protein with FMN-binding domain
MKRVALAVMATIGGLVGLLSFKSHPVAPIADALVPVANPAASATGPAGSAVTGNAGGNGTLAPSAAASAPAGAGSSTPAAPGSSAAGSPSGSRTVTGAAARTRYGTVQVKVTMTGTHIDNVQFAQLTAHDSESQRINAAAAPILVRATLAAQSAKIDTVSGATYTSEGYLQSLQSALDQAK